MDVLSVLLRQKSDKKFYISEDRPGLPIISVCEEEFCENFYINLTPLQLTDHQSVCIFPRTDIKNPIVNRSCIVYTAGLTSDSIYIMNSYSFIYCFYSSLISGEALAQDWN